MREQILSKKISHISTKTAAKMLGIDPRTLQSRARNNPEHPQPIAVNATLWAWPVAELSAFYSLDLEA